jgi:pimeloyl-ACP methyl ester carboxylesterase
MDLLADPEIAALLIEGFRFTIAQGHRAFQIDSVQVVRDWSDLVAASAVPAHLVHGALDPVVRAETVRDFAADHPGRVRLTELEDTGQLVLYAAPETVIDAVDGFFDA